MTANSQLKAEKSVGSKVRKRVRQEIGLVRGDSSIKEFQIILIAQVSSILALTTDFDMEYENCIYQREFLFYKVGNVA